MDLLSIAVGAVGTLITLGLTFGTWLVNQINTIKIDIKEVQTKQDNDRDAKERILDTLEIIREQIFDGKDER